MLNVVTHNFVLVTLRIVRTNTIVVIKKFFFLNKTALVSVSVMVVVMAAITMVATMAVVPASFIVLLLFTIT